MQCSTDGVEHTQSHCTEHKNGAVASLTFEQVCENFVPVRLSCYTRSLFPCCLHWRSTSTSQEVHSRSGCCSFTLSLSFPKKSENKDIFAIICITLLRISPVCLHMILAVSWTLRFWYYFPTTWFHPLCCIEGAVWALQQGAFKNWSLAESSLFSPPTTTMCTLWNLVWSLQNLPLLHLRPPWGTMPVVEVAENDKVGWLNQFLSHRYICLVPVLYVHLNQGIKISSRTFPAQFGLLWICWI